MVPKLKTVIKVLSSQDDLNLKISLSNGDKYECFSGHTEVHGDMVLILAKNGLGQYMKEIFIRQDSVISVEKV